LLSLLNQSHKVVLLIELIIFLFLQIKIIKTEI
jgi:hypothetical protein